MVPASPAFTGEQMAKRIVKQIVVNDKTGERIEKITITDNPGDAPDASTEEAEKEAARIMQEIA
jgi:hypothetical protein